MTNIKHHLNDALLISYAAGNLPEAFGLVVATHVSMCDDCRVRLEAFEAVGGAMLSGTSGDSATSEMEVDLDATLALIAQDPVDRKAPIRIKPGLFPTALQDYVGGDLDAVKWRPVGMGVRQAILPTSKDASVRLLHIPAGCAVPDHGHRGTELTLVLQGAFRDEFDRFGPGDLEIATEEDEHTPVAEAGVDCICLAATDAPLKFRGIIQRIAQPFLRI
ncbi:ChrR family anti-sigma-E factor [Litoreibacter janthinus]|uniref:Anti-ECFsigma factor, ChrR n=1 Tax=Litoreibacter janthinus TaxID=670154 RepID=A0A1I6G3I4_9RHOB|nr:ChrR family anti-sigma-E factor [Litoreibacter janthinus]SFR36756.1 anti-ECFsigma factor, ChrR [Litoreibacter janthinus]